MPLLHDSGGEHLTDEVDESFVLDALAQRVQDDAMGDGVAALDQIGLDDPCGASAVCLSPMAKRLDRVSSGPKAVGAIPKDRFIDRFQDLGHGHGHDPIPDGRNP